MKEIKYFFGIIPFFLLLIISGCSRPPTKPLPPKPAPPMPPCARYHHGTVIFENIGKHNLMLYMHYNTEQYIEAIRSLPITEIPSGSHQYKYKEMETRKQKGGIVTFEVCDCETTYVTLPSKRYYSCGTSP